MLILQFPSSSTIHSHLAPAIFLDDGIMLVKASMHGATTEKLTPISSPLLLNTAWANLVAGAKYIAVPSKIQERKK